MPQPDAADPRREEPPAGAGAAPARPPEPRAAAPPGRGALLRGGLVFAGLSAAGLFLVSRLVPDVLHVDLAALRPVPLALAAAALPLVWALDVARWRVLARGVDLVLSARRALEVMFVYHTASFLTPGSGGGQPAAVWFLHRGGARLEQAVALAVVKPLLSLGWIALGAALALALSPALPRGLSPAAGPGLAFFVLAMLVAALVVVRPAWVTAALLAVLRALGRLPGLSRRLPLDRIGAACARSVDAIHALRRRGAVFVAANLLLAGAWYAASLTLLGLLVLGAGEERPVGQLACDLALFRGLALFAPTPGAAGLGEGGIAWFFGPRHALAIMACWRLASFYVEIALGLGVLAREARSSAGSDAKITA